MNPLLQGLLTFIAAWWITVTFIVVFSNVPIEKVNSTCAQHHGVESVSDHVWGILEGGATVVCKDGKAFALDS